MLQHDVTIATRFQRESMVMESGVGVTQYVLKIAVTTALVVAVSEVARRSTVFGAVLASVPLVSVLAIFWLYMDTGDVTKVSSLATDIFWLVIPSLALFLSLPVLLRSGLGFYPSLAISIAVTIGCYFAVLAVLAHFRA